MDLSHALAAALLCLVSLIAFFYTPRAPPCFRLFQDCDEGRSLPAGLALEDGNLAIIQDGVVSAGWFSDFQDLQGEGRNLAELQSGTQRPSGLSSEAALHVPGDVSLWLQRDAPFLTPRAIRIVGAHEAEVELEIILHTADGGHELTLKNVTVSREGVYVLDLKSAQFLLWQMLEIRSASWQVVLQLRSVQLEYPSPEEVLQEQVDQIRSASPQQLQQRAASRGGPSILVALLSLANESQLRRRLVPAVAILADEVDLLVFVGNTTTQEQAESLAAQYGDLPLVWRNVSDEYPPRVKEFDSWQYVFDNHVEDYDWFLHMDDDTFLNVETLQAFLRGLPEELTNNSQPLYVGSPGFGLAPTHNGLPLDLPIGSDGKVLPFCMGGPGYLLNRLALQRLGPWFDTCLRDWSSELSDTEFGRCVHKHLGVHCAAGSKTNGQLRETFKHLYEDPLSRAENSKVGRLLSTAATLHAIKPKEGSQQTTHMDTWKRLAISLKDQDQE